MKNSSEHQLQFGNKAIFGFPIKMNDITYNHTVNALGYI